DSGCGRGGPGRDDARGARRRAGRARGPAGRARRTRGHVGVPREASAPLRPAAARAGLMPELGRTLIGLGVAIVLLGLLLSFGGRIGLGRLPGDIVLQRGNLTCAVPLATMLVLSVLLTIVLNVIARLGR